MRGIWIENGNAAYRADLDPPDTVDGECRVRVVRAGVCATDLALVRGYMGFTGIPGHEFVGVALDGPHEGKRVVGEINAACGDCDWCEQDLGRHCPNRTVLGILGRAGCFADELVLPAENLLPVPDAVTSDAAIFTEPLAAAFEIAEQIPLWEGETALVVGDGRLGLLCALVLAQYGLDVQVAGRHPERSTILGDAARHIGDLPEHAEQRVDLVVEATGHSEMLARVIPFVRPRGTLILKTTSEAPAQLDLAPIVIDEIHVVGSRCGRFEPALEALEEKRIDVEALIADRYPLERGVGALERAAQRGILKIVIDISDE